MTLATVVIVTSVETGTSDVTLLSGVTVMSDVTDKSCD